MEITKQKLTDQEKEIRDLKRLLDEKEYKLHLDKEKWTLSKLNDQNSKFELLKDNVDRVYLTDTQKSLFDNFKYESPVIWESALNFEEGGWSRHHGYSHYNVIIEVCKKVIELENVHVTPHHRFQFDTENKKVICRTSKQWRDKAQEDDMKLFSDFIRVCAEQGKESMGVREVATKNSIRDLEAKATMRRMTISPDYKGEELIQILFDLVKREIDNYDEFIIYSMYIENKIGSDNNSGSIFLFRWAGVKN